MLRLNNQLTIGSFAIFFSSFACDNMGCHLRDPARRQASEVGEEGASAPLCVIPSNARHRAEVQRLCTGSAISLDSVSVKAQPENNRDTNAKRSGFQSGGSPCRRLRKAIRKIRNRRRTKTSLRPMCRPTRRRKARASRPAARSRKRPDARFGLKQTAFEDRARQGAGRRHCLGRPLCQKVAFCAPLERVAIDRRAMRRRDARVAEEGVRLGAIIAICEARIAGQLRDAADRVNPA
jgi:hypothetical protein